MIRVVVAAVLAVATFAAVLPAVDDARATRTDTVIRGAIDRLERAGDRLATTEDATRTRSLAAARRVEITVPGRSFTAARPAFVAVGGTPSGPGNRSTVTYALSSSPTRRRGLSFPISVRTPDGPVVFREAGRHSVDIALVRTADRPALVVTRGSSG